MDIKKFLPDKKEDAPEYFWAISLEPEWVQAAIWRVKKDEAQIVSSSPPSAWQTDEELLNATDASLTSAIQDFPEELDDPSKVVFGVAPSWVDDGDIKEEYLEKIKNVCKEMSLKPAGFVVLSEAIAFLVKSDEGSPLNAVVLGVYEKSIEVSLFRLGKLTGSAEVARSVSVIDDVTEGLVRLSEEDTVPSRFILYDGKDGGLEDARQNLIKADWGNVEKLNFLHTPKIEIVTSKEKIRAVSLAGASELADVESVRQEGEKEEEDEKASAQASQAKEIEEDEMGPEALGFALERDITQSGQTGASSVNKEENLQKTAAEDKETKKEAEEKKVSDKTQGPRINESQIDGSVENVEPVQEDEMFDKKGLSPISKVAGIFSKIPNPFGFAKKFGVAAIMGRKVFVFGILSLIIILIGGLLFWWYYPKATVTLYLSPRRLEENIEISVDPSIDSPDFEERVLPGEVISTTVSGEKTKSTTGTTTVGERASGEVTLYRVGSSITLSEGTEIIGPGDLEFTLDDDVEVASGSAGSPGTTNASVTAADIGAEYNLASGTTFGVGSYSSSDIEARNDSSFSGGSSREIQAVSEGDREELEEDLEQELVENARGELVGGLSNEETLVEDSLTTTNTSADFSNIVGDEADTLRLSMEIDVEAIKLKENEMTEIAKRTLENKVPDGFVLRDDQIEVEFEFEEEDEGIYVFSAAVTANLLPEVNPDDIAERISGKYPPLAEDFLTKQVPGFVRAEIRIRPNFPGRLNTLPRVAGNIEVEISAER